MGDFSAKDLAMAAYKEIVRELMERIREVRCDHTPRSNNKHVDALATLGAKLDMKEKVEKIEVYRRTLPCQMMNLTESEPLKEDEWRWPLIKILRKAELEALRVFNQYSMLEGNLYHRFTEGMLAKCISRAEGERQLQLFHEAS